MIRAVEFEVGRAFVGCLPPEGDIVAALAEFCRQKGVRTGWISAIGTVRQAVLGYYEQGTQEYLRIPIEQEMEIINCQGNVSFKDGEPFVHLHATLSGRDGETFAGHLFESVVFIGEFWLQELIGPDLQREPDLRSGLSLWPLQ